MIESAGFIVSANALDCVAEAASVTVAVKLAVPVPVGVPEITPVEAFKPKPAGSKPAVIDQLYGVVPPAAANVTL